MAREGSASSELIRAARELATVILSIEYDRLTDEEREGLRALLGELRRTVQLNGPGSQIDLLK